MNRKETDNSMDEKTLAKLAKNSLDKSAEELDEVILGKLKAARREAVTKATENRPSLVDWLMPVTDVIEYSSSVVRQIPRPMTGALLATAATVALTVSIWIGYPHKAEIMPDMDDMSVLSATEDLEFIEELEFYQWLEDEKNVG